MRHSRTIASVTVDGTGEVIELPVATSEEVVASYKTATSYYEAYRKMKNLLQEISINILTKKEK